MTAISSAINPDRSHSFARNFSFLAIVFVLASWPLRAQVATGTPPFGSFSGGPDVINNGNLNVHLAFPVLNKPGRGLPLNYNLTYDSSVWYPAGSSGSQYWTTVANWGWGATVTGSPIGYVTYSANQGSCVTGQWPNLTYWYFDTYTSWVYYDAAGTPHDFNVYTDDNTAPCGPTQQSSTSGSATDNSGFTINITSYTTATVAPTSGNSLQAPEQSTNGNATYVDTNGNEVTATYNSSTSTTTLTDTLGQVLTIVAPSPSPSNPSTYTYIGGSGSQAAVTVKYATYTVRTNFGCSGISESGPSSANLVSEIDLPDIASNPGDKYTFTYESTPGYPGDYTGRLASVTLPTGGTISYGYSGGSNGITCADGSTATLTRTTPDGAWTYAHSESGSAWTTTLTDPQSNLTTLNFQAATLPGSSPATQAPYETERQVASLETIYTCYNGATYSCNGTSITLPITQRTVWTSIGGLMSEVNTNYDSGGLGLATEVDLYGYGSGSAGSLIGKTVTAYNTSLGLIADHPSTVTIYNGSGTTIRQTTYTYDAGSVTATSGTPQHVSVSGSRGDLTGTSTTAQNVTGSITTSATYYDTGMVYQATDPNSNQTTLGYGTSSCGNSFPTSTSMPLSLSTSATWNCYAGLIATSTDENSQQASYSYDLMNRLTQISYPSGGGSASSSYTPTTIDQYRTLTSSTTLHTEVSLDGLGRTAHTYLLSDPSGTDTVNTTYDSLGRTYTVTNPYRSTSDPTYGTTTYNYDALSRLAKVTRPDSNYSQVSYGSGTQSCSTSTYGYGYPALYTDESGGQRRSFTDALGRVIEVDEPDPTNGNSLTLYTCYSYDALGDLAGVSQGSETRTYAYDGLGRLTSSTVPETNQCAVTFSYDSNSNLTSRVAPKEGQTSCGTTATTAFGYDALNRLTSKSYNDSITPTVYFYYDQTSYNGLTINYGKARLTGMSDGSGETAWSYDPMGRPLTVQQTIGSVTKDVSYSLNYDGSMASLTYPSGRTISFDITGAGLPTYAKDTGNNINYALSTTYAPQGGLASTVNGQASGFNGITDSIGYNNRLLPTSIAASSSNGTALSLSYSYFANGDVDLITNSRDNGRTVTYGYDSLNRITSASSQATSGADCWGQSVPSGGYDRYANLLTVNVSKCSAPALSLTLNTYNHVTNAGFSYDAAGEVTNDGTYSYSWDAEGRMTGAGSTTYTFDGNGRRVKKSSGTLYWYGGGSSVLAETDTSGNTTNEYIFFAGRRIARRDSSGNIYYHFTNHLGSSASITNSSGSLCYDADFYPFGGEFAFTNTCGQNYKFAGMERDSETGLDHTMFRQYASNLGRWLSPDPLAGDISNPQSLNRYAYVMNNPTTLTDPSGLQTGSYTVPWWGDCSQNGYGNGCWWGSGGEGDIDGYFMDFGRSIFSPDAAMGALAEFESPNPAAVLIGMSSEPLSGDYGAGLPIPPPNPGMPCDFGTCGSAPTMNFSPGATAAKWNNTFWNWLDHLGWFPMFDPNAGFHALLPGQNYCGPGNMGYDSPTRNDLDKACRTHDLAYDKAGITWKNAVWESVTPQQAAAKAAADQELCRAAANVIPSTPNESANRLYVLEWPTFHCP